MTRKLLALLLALALGFGGAAWATDLTDTTIFSESDASNNSASNPGFPEGMAPSRVNDAARALQGAVKRAYDRDHGGTWATVGGTANAITLTYGTAPAAYVQGEKYAFKATAANTGATTVNINGLGAKNVFNKTPSGAVACIGGEIKNGDLVEIEYDGTQFQILGPMLSGTIFASGTTVDVVSTASPANFFVYALPANTLGTSRHIRVTLLGDLLNNTGSNQTLQMTGLLGGTTFFDTTAVTISSSATRRSIKVIVDIQGNGATNAQYAESDIITGGGGGGDSVTAVSPSPLHAYANMAEDTTTARNIAITATLGVSSANLSARMRGVTIELL